MLTSSHQQGAVEDMDEALVCVVGHPRSGTHWLQRVLAAHPDVSSIPGETYLFSHGLEPLFDRFHHATPTSPGFGQLYIERDELVRHARALCDATFRKHLETDSGGATKVVERTPVHLRYIDLIAEIYPTARFVHIIRDPEQVVRSVLDQSWGATDAEDAATEWRDDVLRGRALGAEVAHYTEVLYHRLKSDPGPEVARLFEMIGVDASDAAIQAAVDEAGVVANTTVGAARPPLSRRQTRVVRKITQDLMQRLEAEIPATVTATAADRRPLASSRSARQVSDWLSTNPREQARAINHLLGVLRGAETADIDDLLADDVDLRVRVDGVEHRWRGPGDLPELLRSLRSASALEGHVRWSAAHTCIHLHTLVIEGDEGSAVVIVRVGRDRITEIAVYQHPMVSPVSAGSASATP